MTKWVTKKLGEICEKITDGSHDSPKPVDDGYYMPSVKDMRHDNFDFSDCKQISKNDFERLKGTGCKPEIGDVLIAKDGSILKYCFVVEQDLPIVILSSIAILRPDKSIIDGKFLSYYFQKEDVVTDVVENYKSGTGVPRIVLRNFEQIEIPYPESLAEQRRIAGILSSADGPIAASEALIAKYRNIKRGLLATLLQPKEGWKKVKLGECLTIGNGQDYKHLHKGDIPVYGTGGVMTYVDDYLYEGETVCIGRKGTINKPIFHCGTIWTVDTLFYTHSFVNVLPLFMYYAFCCIDWLRYNEATGVPSLSKETIYKIEINIPEDLAEQRRIAEILSSVDAKIAAEEKVVEKYKGVKKGLMEELLKSEK